MFNFLKNVLLNQELKQTNSKRQFVEWATVKNICVVIPNETSFLNAVKTLATESKKEVDAVVLHADKLSVNKEVYLSFNKKDLTWLGLPNAEAIKRLRAKNYDIVICGDISGNFSLKALTLLIPAKCRLGSAELAYADAFEIAIAGETKDFGNFLKQALKYLMMIKAN